jgi:hypothetical protein
MERQQNVHAFVGELLDTGGALIGIVENLTDALTEQGYTRQDALAELFEMLIGTISLKFASIPASEIDRAAELMALALQAVMTDLERALELSRRRQRDPCGASVRRR